MNFYNAILMAEIGRTLNSPALKEISRKGVAPGNLALRHETGRNTFTYF